MMSGIQVPDCYNYKDFMEGVRYCQAGILVDTECMSDDFNAGYAYQYEREQIETQRGYGNVNN